jgi:4-amino-4-deoxy-L-arabinose transferase-like glycosyltransferase
MTILTKSRTGWRDDLILLPVILLLFFSMGLSARPYMAPSEARYIEIPRQMVETGDWLTPHINGVPYFEKPPLFYWMQASIMQIGGLGEFSGRTATVILTTLTCLLAYGTARMLYGRLSGLFAASVLATCLLGYGLSRIALLDVPVTFFITACMACFLGAGHAQGPRQRNLYWLMYATSALAVLCKGLIGMVLPGLIIGLWIALTRHWALLRQTRIASGTLLFLAIVTPWHLLMAREHPDFLNFYFIHEHWTRFISDGHRRTAPWWFFLAVAGAGFLPWTGLLPAILRRLKGNGWQQLRHHPEDLLMALWVMVPLVFFSLSQSKLASYIFVIFPPLAILAGRTLHELWEGQLPVRILRRMAGLFMAFLALVPAAWQAWQDRLSLPPFQPFLFLPFFIPLLVLAYVLCFRRSAQAHIATLALAGAGLGISINNSAAGFDMSGIRPLAYMLAPRLAPGDMVVTYREYWQDLPVYLDRNVTVVDWQGELEHGIRQAPETKEWMLSGEEFQKRCASHRQEIFMLVRVEIFNTMDMPPTCRFNPLAVFGKSMLAKRMKTD